VARYARGRDYHYAHRDRMKALRKRLLTVDPDLETYACVDTGQAMEKAWAERAGLGWIGKNGCLLDSRQGSYRLLAEIVTDLDLPPDEPVAEQCGSCTRCLDACPTGAFLEPGVLDAGRCLAYWTIEHRGAIPDAWKAAIGDHVFGCDVCQEVCPWNAPLAALVQGEDAREAGRAPTRAEVLAMGKGAWRRRFGTTAVNRAARRGLQRNAAASAGALRDASCRPALEAAARIAEPGLSDAARWALDRLDRVPL
jgi:epoxyqueuosine reductase